MQEFVRKIIILRLSGLNQKEYEGAKGVFEKKTRLSYFKFN